MSLQQPATDWYMDTAATAHMSADAGTLHSLSPHPIYRQVVVGNGSSIPVATSGHLSLHFFLIILFILDMFLLLLLELMHH